MATNSPIEWTDATWNPVTGWSKISSGCKHCYAERLANRLQAMGQRNYRNGFKLTLQPQMLELPLKWKAPKRIFVNSMSDLFHEDVPLSFIKDVFDMMRRARWHQYQVLTKRADRARELSLQLQWEPQIWMGVSFENEQYLDRIDHLRKTVARIKFLSLERLLGPLRKMTLRGIDWVIVGGESGPGTARKGRLRSRPELGLLLPSQQRSCPKPNLSYSRRELMRTWAQKPNSGLFRKSPRASEGKGLLCRILPIGILAGICFAGDWPQYRGPNGSGVGYASRLPTEFGPEKNVVWKTPVPFGYSSPVIKGDLIFITGAEGGPPSNIARGSDKLVYQGKLYTLAINCRTGKIVWRREAPRNRVTQYQTNNSPATPSAVTDDQSVYVLFQDFGLLAYTKDGAERWRLPLGPFTNENGVGSSPILYGDLVVLICDQDSRDAYLLAVDKNTGRVRWKTARSESTRSYATPALFQPKDGRAELIVPGPFQVTGYYAATGEKAWWVRGLWWQPKSVPVIDGDTIYAIAADPQGASEKQDELPAFTELLAKYDANHDGKLTMDEFSGDSTMQKIAMEVDRKGFFDEGQWNLYRARTAARNNLLAIRHGGHGDLTDTNVIWSMNKYLPCCTSPLIYQGVMYLVKEGGILTALDPKTGKILKQGRLTSALGDYYASPVGAAGKVFLLSQQGKATVVKAGADWEILAVNDLDDESYATPAIVDDKLYVRTHGTLYCFGDKK